MEDINTFHSVNGDHFVWTGKEWESAPPQLSHADLLLHDKYPALKDLWEEYHIMRKLLTGE